MREFLKSALVGGALFGCLAMAAAQEGEQEGSNEGAATQDQDAQTDVALFNSAIQLADLGRAEEDPLLLIAAARTLISLGRTPAEAEDVETGTLDADAVPADLADKASSDEGEEGDKAESSARSLVDSMLSEAQLFAAGNDALMTIIDQTKEAAKSMARGSVSGSGYWRRKLSARSYVNLRQRYIGNETAEVALRGDGDTDVDLFVFDARGNQICRSTTYSDREYCRWVPRWTGDFVIRVVNHGRVWNDVTVLTN
jgi:hypothetical protein